MTRLPAVCYSESTMPGTGAWFFHSGEALMMSIVDSMILRRSILACGLALPWCLCGCGGGQAAKPAASATASGDKSLPVDAVPAETGDSQPAPQPKFDAVALGGAIGTSEAQTEASTGSESEQMESVVQALQPLQVMLGKWRGTTNQKFKGFSAVEELEWIWDFKTNRAQPALIVKSDKSPYIREGRLTYVSQDQTFQFTVKTPEGVEHVMRGKFEREPDEFTGDDNKPQRTYKLVMAESEPQGNEAWRVALDHQENNRYLVQLSRKRGSGQFQLADTIGTQRLGTSFAANDEDYGDRKCIISGGLGTMTVSYNDKTYWVCCTGCQSAFNDDPKRWLAKMEAADKAKQK